MIRIVLVILICSIANPAIGQVIHTIPSPVSSSLDITFEGNHLWLASTDSTLYKISPIDGTVLKTIQYDTDYAYGLAFDGTDLWVSDRRNQLIARLDTLDGTILHQFPLLNSGVSGLAWGNNSLWLNNNNQGLQSVINGDTTFHFSVNGELLDYYIPPGPQPSGLTFDGSYLWSSDNYFDKIFKIDPDTYELIDEIDAPGGDFPNGLAFDGQYLWLANNDRDSLYQIDIGIVSHVQEEEHEFKNSYSVYPNPSTGQFFFDTDFEGNMRNAFVTIYDILGHVIFKESMNDNKLGVNLEGFSANLFFYTITINKEIIVSGKLIKN